MQEVCGICFGVRMWMGWDEVGGEQRQRCCGWWVVLVVIGQTDRVGCGEKGARAARMVAEVAQSALG